MNIFSEDNRGALGEITEKVILVALCIFLFWEGSVKQIDYSEIDSIALPTISIQYHMSIVMDEHDLELARKDFPELYQNIYDFEDLRSSKLLFTKDDKWMSFYFPIYSAACIPIKLVLTFLNKSQVRTFALTNALFLVISFLCFFRSMYGRKYRILWLLLLFASPIHFYIHYICYEVFVFSMLLVSLSFYIIGKRKTSAFFLSLGGMANSALMAVGIVMIARYLYECIFSERYNRFYERFIDSFSRLFSLETVLYACCFIPCLIPFAVQKNLIGRSVFSVGETVSEHYIERYLSYLFDPSLGFCSFAGIQLLIALFLLVFLFIRNKWYFVQYSMMFFGVVGSVSLMTHINCDMRYCARYVVWIYPCLVFMLLAESDCIEGLDRIRTVLLLASILCSGGMIQYNRGVSYIKFNRLTKAILDNVPSIYNPYSAIFYNRVLHIDGGYNISKPAYYTDSNGSGLIRKMIVKGDQESKEKVLRDLIGDGNSLEALEIKIHSISNDGKYHYLNFPRSSKIALRVKTILDNGYSKGDVILDVQKPEFFKGDGYWIHDDIISIDPNTYYCIDLSLSQDFSFRDGDTFFVDFYGPNYDNKSQEINDFICDNVYEYELFVNSEETGPLREVSARIVSLQDDIKVEFPIQEIKITKLYQYN